MNLFTGLVQRITIRCRGWHTRLLSQGGKVVLIKSVLQTMPSHVFYAINPPKAVVKQIEKLLAGFLGEIRWEEASLEFLEEFSKT